MSQGWDQHEVEQRRRWRSLSYAERLAWLWQAKLFANQATAAAAARKAAQKKSGAD